MQGISVDRTLEVAERIAQRPLERASQAELLGQLTLLAGVRLPWKELIDKIRSNAMVDELWEASSMGREYYEALKAEGRAERASAGMRKMARVALEGKFGTFPEDMLAALEIADEAALVTVVGHIASDTLEEPRARLGLS